MNFDPSSNMAAFRALMFLVILSICSAANFVMFPMFGRSHYMFEAKLGQELTERGHQVRKFSQHIIYSGITIFRTSNVSKCRYNWLERYRGLNSNEIKIGVPLLVQGIGYSTTVYTG